MNTFCILRQQFLEARDANRNLLKLMTYREFIELCKELRRLQEEARKPMTRYEHKKAKERAEAFEKEFDKKLKEL